jgi:hypothetical protein
VPSLILHCLPLVERGVGSAWGFPVIRDGKKRYSALAASETLSAGEAEELGLGPLGRYLGGEPVKPVRLGAGEIFGFAPPPGVAGLFCRGLEFDRDRWLSRGNLGALFQGHLEFLRTWGLSGGLITENNPASAELFGNYLRGLNSGDGKIIVLLEKRFFEDTLKPFLPEVEASGHAEEGTIPLNWGAGGETVLAGSLQGLGLVFFEELPPVLKPLRPRCDLLVLVLGPGGAPDLSAVREIKTPLTLGIVFADGPVDKTGNSAPRGRELFRTGPLGQSGIFLRSGQAEAYLWRSLLSSTGVPPPLAFPARYAGTKSSPLRADRPFSGSREEAAAFGLLPLWEKGRLEGGGGLFAVKARFGGIRAADFRGEQEELYQTGRPCGFVPPPGGSLVFASGTPGTSSGTLDYAGMNEAQRNFFFFWRSRCRKGDYADSADYYLGLYGRELVLSLGKEGALGQFMALWDLCAAYRDRLPAASALLARWALDFAVIYGITGEALPLLDGILSLLEGAAGRMARDLALRRLCTASPGSLISALPFIIPLLSRQAKERLAEDTGENFSTLLADLDRRLYADWGRGLFEIFYPPTAERADFTGFEKCPAAGESSYTVLWGAFSNHKPLTELLSGLVLDPEKQRLALGVPPRGINLEEELLDQLRRESDEVRELLKGPAYGEAPGEQGRPETRRIKEVRTLPDSGKLGKYLPPGGDEIGAFLAGLDGGERAALRGLLEAEGFSGVEGGMTAYRIDRINTAFEERFHDLLIVENPGDSGFHEGDPGYHKWNPSISEEYRSILQETLGSGGPGE